MVKVAVSARSEDTLPANFIFPHLHLPLTLTSASTSTPNHHFPPPPAPAPLPSPPPLQPSSTQSPQTCFLPQPFPLLSLLDGFDLPSLFQPIFISCSISSLDFLAPFNHNNLPELALDLVVFQAARSSLPDLPSSTPPASPLLICILARKCRPHEATSLLHSLKHLDCTSDVFAYTSLITAFTRVAAVVGECATRQMVFS